MSRARNEWGWTLVIALAASLLGARWQAEADRYPFYLAWDMDLVTSLDLLAIHDGELPDHVHHPGVAMYLALSAEQRIDHALGGQGAWSLRDVERSLNPLAVMADHTAQLRGVVPWLCLVLVLAWWVALVVAVRAPPWLALPILLYLGLQDGLVYQASYVRSEVFAATYLAIGLALAALWRRRGLAAGRALWGPALGLALGLALLGKVQVIACCALPLVLLAWDAPRDAARPLERRALAVGLIAWAVFSALMLAAAGHEVAAGSVTYTQTYQLGATGLAVWGAATGLVGLQVAGRLSPRVPGGWTAAADHLAYAAAGFVAAFATPLLLYADLGTGLRLVLLTTKLTFWRGAAAYWGDGSAASRFNHSPGSSLGEVLAYQPEAFLVAALVGLWLVFAWRRGWGQVARRQVLAYGGLLVLVVAQLAVATRPALRDLIWLDLLVGSGLVLGLSALGSGARRRRKAQVALCVALAAGILIGERRRAAATPARVEPYSAIDGWQPYRWLFGWYRVGNSARYRAFMESHYTIDRAGAAWQAAAQVADDVAAARFAFPGRAIGPRHVGRLAAGWPALLDGGELGPVPAALAGALLVDAGAAEPTSPVFPRPDQLSRYDELGPPRTPATGVFVRPRPDRNLLLFLADPPPLDQPAWQGRVAPTPWTVDVGSRRFTAHVLLAEAELPLEPGRWFGALVAPDRPPAPGRGMLLGALEPSLPPLPPLAPGQIPVFARALGQNPSRWERFYSAVCLGRFGVSAPAAAALRAALDDEDAAVRLAAARSLSVAGAGDPDSRQALAARAGDPDPRVRAAVEAALATWGD